MKHGMKHLLLSFLFFGPFIGLASGIAHAACPPAPVGSVQDRVIQMVAGGDGMVRMGSNADVDATEEGAIVYDAANNTAAICDGTKWIQLGRNGGGGPVLIGNGTSCSAGDEGAVRYTSGDPPFQYCDGGGNWLPFRQPRCQNDGAGECFLDANRANDDPQFTAANICSGANILGVSGTAVCTPPDTTPDAFSFTDQTGVAISTLITSNIVTISGITGSVNVSVTGGGSPQVRINGGAWVTSGTIENGQTLQVRLTSSASYGAMHSATVTVGTVSDQWDVTTESDPSCPATPGPGNEGCVMPDGSVYAGLSPDGNVAMYTTPADAPGTRTWNDGSTNYIHTGMVTCWTTESSCQTGEANTALLVGLSGSGSPAPYAAAEYCDGLNAHGHSDWYLPAQDELNVLYTNRTAIGGFNTVNYWSSSESGSHIARLQRFSDGVQSTGTKHHGLAIRCVRNDLNYDQTPVAFSFTDQTGVATSTLTTSNNVTITGITGSVNVSVTGDGSPQVRINGGTWVTSGTIENGQTLQVRLTSSASYSTMHSATITVGTVSDQWNVTTESDPNCPATPGPGNEGCVMPDGSIFAGDTNLYVTDVDQSTAIRWSHETVTNTGARSASDGAANQAWIVANRTLSQYPVFEVCENLNRHGHTDWHLPALNELNVLYTNRAAIGGFTGGTYWSSTEFNTIHVWRRRFIAFSNQGTSTKSTHRHIVRCVRRH